MLFLFGCASHRGATLTVPPPPSQRAGQSADQSADQSLEKMPGYTADLMPGRIPDGTLAVLSVTFDAPSFAGKITARFEDQVISLYPLDPSHFQGLFGVPHHHAPGTAFVTVTPAGLSPARLSFEIVDAHYASETLTVNESRVNPPKKVMARILREVAEVAKVYKHESSQRYWNGPFVFPVDSVTTSPFGSMRIYNGQLMRVHKGLDFRAAVGTPVHAAAAARVVLAKNLYYSGNTVILDHGYGLLTLYFHMSLIKVKKGQRVAQGQLLGLSGKTGRVTGPHVHWQVMIHDVPVDPLSVMRELK